MPNNDVTRMEALKVVLNALSPENIDGLMVMVTVPIFSPFRALLGLPERVRVKVPFSAAARVFSSPRVPVISA